MGHTCSIRSCSIPSFPLSSNYIVVKQSLCICTSMHRMALAAAGALDLQAVTVAGEQ